MASPTYGHEFELAPGVGDGQGGLECCSPWGHEEFDRTELLNNHHHHQWLGLGTLTLQGGSLVGKPKSQQQQSVAKKKKKKSI